MANEFITRNGIISLDNSQVTGSLNVSNGIIGNLTGTATTASYVLNAVSASRAVSSSLALQNVFTASVSNNVITFTEGDGTTFSLTVATGSSAVSASRAISAANADTASYVLNAVSASRAVSALSSSFATTASFAVSASWAPVSGFPFTGSAQITGSLGVTGSVTATSIIETSALKYKQNVQDLEAVDGIYKLRPVTFDWIATLKPDLGFIAEEVNEVFPLLAELNGDGEVEGVKYSKLTALLTKIVQNHQQEITSLKLTVELMKEEINNLKNK